MDIVIPVPVLSHIVLLGELITGVGSTVITTFIAEPEHNNAPGAVPVHGVIIYVAVWAVDPILSRVWLICVPRGVPLAPPAVAPVMLAPTAPSVHV